MTELRRSAPEIERELHDKEARIRELEAALRRLIDAETKYRWTHDLKGDRHLNTGRAWDRMRKASVEANDLLANSPPDSEPAEGGEKCLVCDGTGNLYGRQPEGMYGYAPCHNCKGTGKPPMRGPAERQAAMLERREALPAWIRHRLNGAVRQYRHNNDNSPSLSNPEKGFVFAYDCGAVETLIHRILHALSRTRDEGTGCVVPEAIKRLPYELRREAENRCGCCDPDATMPGCDCMNLDDARGEGRDQEKLDIASRLDRAIAQQGK